MKKTVLFTAIIAIAAYGCKKENLTNPTNSSFVQTETNDDINVPEASYRVFGWRGSGPGTVEPYCSGVGGNCFPDFVVTAMYAEFVNVVVEGDQINFFKNNSYGTVYEVEEDVEIQSRLETGALKVKIVTYDNTDFNLFIDPEFENLSLEELVGDKVVLVIPAVY